MKVEWDYVIDSVVPKWEGICNRLKSFDKIMIERCYFIYHIHNPIENCYLHGFLDSPLSAYAACIYLKSLSRSGNVFLQFVTAKSRVVPLKKANCTTFGVNWSIYFIKLNEYCAWKFKRRIEYWKLLLLGRFTNGTCMD